MNDVQLMVSRYKAAKKAHRQARIEEEKAEEVFREAQRKVNSACIAEDCYRSILNHECHLGAASMYQIDAEIIAEFK